jgi:hypothetical protein
MRDAHIGMMIYVIGMEMMNHKHMISCLEMIRVKKGDIQLGRKIKHKLTNPLWCSFHPLWVTVLRRITPLGAWAIFRVRVPGSSGDGPPGTEMGVVLHFTTRRLFLC